MIAVEDLIKRQKPKRREMLEFSASFLTMYIAVIKNRRAIVIGHGLTQASP